MTRFFTRLGIAVFSVLLISTSALAFEVKEVPAADSAPAQTSESGEGDATAPAQPGDGLDLSAVLETFKEAQDVADFEARLNDPDAGIVNLDLNGDDEVDFVGVFEEGEGEVHVLILRAFLGEEESQDVASIQLERKGEDVTVQVVGVPALYGPDYIVEPDLGEETSRSTWLAARPAIEPIVIASADESWWPTFTREERDGSFQLAAVVVVRTWSTVRVIYVSGYRYYRSPYRWHRYPSYHRARRPVARSNYRNRHTHHRNHHRRTTHRRSTHASNVYKSNAVSSPRVQKASPATGAGPKASATPSSSPSATQSRQPTTKQSTQQQRKSTTGGPTRAGPSGGGARARPGGSPQRRR